MKLCHDSGDSRSKHGRSERTRVWSVSDFTSGGKYYIEESVTKLNLHNEGDSRNDANVPPLLFC
jgi:hypothetical protein